MQNILATLYMLAFAACGILVARPVFRRDDPIRRFFYGLVFGLVMLIWLPTLYAFLFRRFSLAVQLISLFTAVLGAAAATITACVRFKGEFRRPAEGELKKQLVPLLIAAVPLTVICFTLHINHTITNASNGSLHVGQCTYGDLCMHLGFISSISVQQTFPPMYSLLPDTLLGYPFLCDSVSSTFYTLGATLRLSALLPALYACLVTVLGVYLFFNTWFKRAGSSVLATYLFFIGGGFGFWYFLNNKQILAADGVDRMKELLEGFYKMPTNLPAEGLRWVNSIADMLLPQRATLFGWSLLFPALQLLYRGAVEKENKVFIPLAFIAGGMPLVHTHSFLALGIISMVLFIANALQLLIRRRDDRSSRLAIRSAGCFIAALILAVLNRLDITVESEIAKLLAPRVGTVCFAVLAALMAVFELILALAKKRRADTAPVIIIAVSAIVAAAALIGFKTGSVLSVLAPLAGIAACIILALDPLEKRSGAAAAQPGETVKEAIAAERRNLLFFALFGVITVALASPQVFGFTLKQSGASDSFLRWHLNWDNRSDSWLWFYIKNLGLIFLLMPAAFFCLKRRDRVFYSGGLAIWAICEILLFQPNPYDNNKLLFVWFALTCGIVGDFIATRLARPVHKKTADEHGETHIALKPTLARLVLLMTAFFALFTSGVMTLAREYVSGDHIGTVTNENGAKHLGLVESGYEVVPNYLVETAEWIKINTENDATFLTHNNHNNAVAMLTGRNLFVGSGTFLHWHGVNYEPRQAMLKGLFENPAANLFKCAEQYGIDYVLISPQETGTYKVDTGWFMNNLECVYQNERVKLFALPGVQPSGTQQPGGDDMK